MYLTQSLRRRLQTTPEATFTVYRGRETSVCETADRVARWAHGLQQLGVSTDDRVALLDINSDYFVQASLAVAWADGVLVPVNYRWSMSEIAYSLDETDTRVVIVGDKFLGLVDDLREACPQIAAVVHAGDEPTPDGVIPLSRLLAESPVPDAERQGDAVMGIFYTGGTTGVPKGVMLSHRSVVLSPLGTIAAGRNASNGVALLSSPAFHMAGFSSVIANMLTDNALVILPEFDLREVMRLVAQYRVTSTVLVPTMIQMIVDSPEAADYDMSSLLQVAYGAAPMTAALLDRAAQVFPNARFFQSYGMTELAPVATVLRAEDHDHPVHRTSVGRAAVNALVKIVDPDDNEVPRGEVGEIVCQGDHVMLGYWNKPEETARALRGGWMHTGDGGYMDEDGYVYLVDRLKDMIISGGENVYSVEVERVIAQHPAVVQCAVIGLPDEKWGERVHAIVELRPGASLDIDELRAFCKRAIAGYKSPVTMETIESWPISGAGKILKRELRAART